MISITSVDGCELLGVIEGSQIRRSSPHIISSMPYNEFPQVLQTRWSELCFQAPPINIYRVPNVFVCDEGIVITTEGEVIEETIHQTPIDQIDRYTNQLKNVSINSTVGVTKKAVLIKKYGSANYGHFLYEMAPKLYAIRLAGIDDTCKFILYDCPSLNCVATDLFSMAGINSGQLIFSDSTPMFVEELIVVTGLSRHSIYASPIIQDFYDDISRTINASTLKNIYVSRKGATRRTFINEDSVETLLIKNNFDIVQPEFMTLHEQIQLFKGAHNIIGISGAALTNCLFSQPDSRLLCIMPESALEVLFWQLCNISNVVYTEWRVNETGNAIGPLPWDKNLIVDMGVLDSTVKNIFN